MIEIKNLTKKFYADHDALCNISHKTDSRPFIIIGDEDSGKTTLLNIIAGLDMDYSGEVIIDGVERKNLSLRDGAVSYIMEEPVLFQHKSVYKNLEYVFKVQNKKFDKASAQKEIKEVSEELQIFGILDKKVSNCSRHQKLLVCIARASLKKAKIIIVDEPFSNLYNFEISGLWQSLLSVSSKLSSDLVVAEKPKNTGYFEGCNILHLSFGTKIGDKTEKN